MSGRKPTQEKELRPCSITPSKLLTQFYCVAFGETSVGFITQLGGLIIHVEYFKVLFGCKKVEL